MNPNNCRKVVRFPDIKIIRSMSDAAKEIGVTFQSIEAALKRGFRIKGFQFMDYQKWIKAGKPSTHPISLKTYNRAVVRLPNIIFANLGELCSETGLSRKQLYDIIRRGQVNDGYQYMWHDEWEDRKSETHPANPEALVGNARRSWSGTGLKRRPFTRRPHSQEHRDKISANNRGKTKPFSKEHREALRQTAITRNTTVALMALLGRDLDEVLREDESRWL